MQATWVQAPVPTWKRSSAENKDRVPSTIKYGPKNKQAKIRFNITRSLES